MDPNLPYLWWWKLPFEPYLQNCLERSAKVAWHPICTIPLSIRQLTRTPLYLVLFYVSLNSSNTRSSIELRKKFNLISKNFLESGLSRIWRLNLNPAGSLRMLGQNSSELRNQETKRIESFRSVKLHDFAGHFTRLCWCFHTLLSKICFHGWTPSLDWGISSLLIILGKYAGKLLKFCSLTINSFTTVTIGF